MRRASRRPSRRALALAPAPTLTPERPNSRSPRPNARSPRPNLLVSSIATCPRNMKIYIEKWGEWSEKNKKKRKKEEEIFSHHGQHPYTVHTMNRLCSKHKPNQINKRRRTSSGYTVRERGSHGFCAQYWTGHPLVPFLPRYRVGIPQLAHNLGWWQWPWK